MTAALTWSAGAVRMTPIAYEPEQRALALTLVATTFPTWRAALEFCDARQVAVFNRAEAEHAAAVQQPELPLSGVA